MIKAVRLTDSFGPPYLNFHDRVEIEGGALLSVTMPPDKGQEATEELFGQILGALDSAGLKHQFFAAERGSGKDGELALGFDDVAVAYQAQGAVKLILNNMKLGYVLGFTEYHGGKIVDGGHTRRFCVSNSMECKL